MPGKITRRNFLEGSALAVTALTAPALPRTCSKAHGQPSSSDAPSPSADAGLLLGGTAALCKPQLAPSQLSFRIGLARKRTAAYPLDSMDFIMLDLERPEGSFRHAYQCTGDLTGRLLEFLSVSAGVDGQSDPRLETLFERILKQRQSGGFLGKYGGNNAPNEACNKTFHGLVRYHELSGDIRALEAAHGVAEFIWSKRGALGLREFSAWVCEPFARLYGITREPRWLEICDMIRTHPHPTNCAQASHAHGYMSVLRGLQATALVTGDKSWADKPEQNRRVVIEKRLETPDGCPPELFPRSVRNEGCAIADWLMLNLNAGLISGNDQAYAKAERIFWNALAFNQFTTGCFGCRTFVPNGYGAEMIEEAWWCCLHNAGMAMSELARHVVTFREGAIHVNFLFPGQFEVPLPGGATAKVTIATPYPARAEATIVAENVPADMDVHLRIPDCVRKGEVTPNRDGRKLQLAFKGKLGHRVEQCNPGVMLTYGPLVLVPATYRWEGLKQASDNEKHLPEGYMPESLPKGTPILQLDRNADADGFVGLEPGPLPEWTYVDYGPVSRTWVEGAEATVPVKFPNGNVKPLRFTPECYNTSCLAWFETPVVFHDA